MFDVPLLVKCVPALGFSGKEGLDVRQQTLWHNWA